MFIIYYDENKELRYYKDSRKKRYQEYVENLPNTIMVLNENGQEFLEEVDESILKEYKAFISSTIKYLRA